jgi:hypothetical protein
MTRQTWFSPNVCTGLIVLALSAMACALVYSGVVVLLMLRP